MPSVVWCARTAYAVCEEVPEAVRRLQTAKEFAEFTRYSRDPEILALGDTVWLAVRHISAVEDHLG